MRHQDVAHSSKPYGTDEIILFIYSSSLFGGWTGNDQDGIRKLLEVVDQVAGRCVVKL